MFKESGNIGKKKFGFFARIKNVCTGNHNKELKPSKSREDENNNSFGKTLSLKATRTRSRRSLFGSYKDSKEIEAERDLEERKSKCLAIQAAKRDPPAVQRLVVDCEFCNPPPDFGIPVAIPSPEFTSEISLENQKEVEHLRARGADLSDERTWNIGLNEWIIQRERWLTPNNYQQKHHFLEPDLTSSRYYLVYDKLVYQTRPLKHPLNLSDAIKIIKCGWIAEGTWQTQGGWSSSDEDIRNAPVDSLNIAPEHSAHPAYRPGLDYAPPPLSQPVNNLQLGHEADQQSNEHLSLPSDPPLDKTQDRKSGQQSENMPDTWSNQNSVPSLTLSGASPSKEFYSISHQPSRVQFRDPPHLRDLKPILSNGLPELTRLQSAMSIPSQRDRSSHSSIISLTDDE